MKIKIDHQYKTLNEYIQVERGNKFAAANLKSEETNVTKLFCIGKKWYQYPCKITFTWHLKDKRKDLDDVSFSRKFILDGLVKGGLLENDNLTKIQGFEDKVIFDDREYVELDIEEMV